MDQMKILLIVDHVLLGSALRLWLEEKLFIQVVGEVTELGALLATVEVTLPDILLLDWEISRAKLKGSIHQLLQTLRIRFPQLRVIALSLHPELKKVALEAGVDAFVTKIDLPDYLLDALRRFIKESQATTG